MFEQDGVKIHVDAKSLALVDGTVIDFGKHGLSETFTFSNPNATAECGCGESFTTDADGLTVGRGLIVLVAPNPGWALAPVQGVRWPTGCPATPSAP